jgi:ribonuclease HI
MIVTINTDASWHPKFKVGAYAFWIVCDQGRITHAGPLKEASGPTDAELRCIANALHALLKSDFTDIQKVIINSDALYAFGMVGKKKQEKSPGRVCADILTQLKRKHMKVEQRAKPIHEFRHVKAHSGTAEKRKWVNNWCDKAAKRELGKLIHTQQSITISNN